MRVFRKIGNPTRHVTVKMSYKEIPYGTFRSILLQAGLKEEEFFNFIYMVDKIFVAMKAFIVHDGKVLLLRESSKYSDGANVGKFDVVGGRVEPGQRFDESLLREITEETGLNVKIGRPFFVNEWRPVVRGEQWQIVGTFFECLAESEDVKLSADHSEFTWIDPNDYKNYNIIDNLIPAFESYLNLLYYEKDNKTSRARTR